MFCRTRSLLCSLAYSVHWIAVTQYYIHEHWSALAYVAFGKVVSVINIMPNVINDCLGLTQYLTQHLGREATDYLLTFASLSAETWKEAKGLLPGAFGTPNRSTKEATIRDCVEIFVDSMPEDTYLVSNLGLLPGLQPESLKFIDNTVKTLFAVKHTTDRVLQVKEARHADTQRDLLSTVSSANPPSSIFQEGDFPSAKLQSQPALPTNSEGSNSTAQRPLYSNIARQQALDKRTSINVWY